MKDDKSYTKAWNEGVMWERERQAAQPQRSEQDDRAALYRIISTATSQLPDYGILIADRVIRTAVIDAYELGKPPPPQRGEQDYSDRPPHEWGTNRKPQRSESEAFAALTADALGYEPQRSEQKWTVERIASYIGTKPYQQFADDINAELDAAWKEHDDVVSALAGFSDTIKQLGARNQQLNAALDAERQKVENLHKILGQKREMVKHHAALFSEIRQAVQSLTPTDATQKEIIDCVKSLVAALDAERKRIGILERAIQRRNIAIDDHVKSNRRLVEEADTERQRHARELADADLHFDEVTKQLLSAQAAIREAIDILVMQDNAGKGRTLQEVSSRNQQAIDHLRNVDQSALDEHDAELFASVGWHQDSGGLWNCPSLHIHGREKPTMLNVAAMQRSQSSLREQTEGQPESLEPPASSHSQGGELPDEDPSK